MLYELKSVTVCGMKFEVYATLNMPPDVIVFKDKDGNELGRIVDIPPPERPQKEVVYG